MSESVNTFLNGLKMFQQGAKQFATDRAFSSAAEELKTLTAGIENEGEKRRAQAELSNRLTADLARIGADPSQIQTAAASFGPRQFRSPDEMITEATISQDNDLLGAGLQAQKLIGRDDRQLRERGMGLQERGVGLQERGVALDEAKFAKSQQAMAGIDTLRQGGTVSQLSKEDRERFINNVSPIRGMNIKAMATTGEQAKEILASKTSTDKSLSAVDSLLNDGLSRFNLKDRKKAAQLVAELKSGVRIAVTGGGNISLFEQQMLDELSPNPTAILSYTPAQKAGLESIRDKIQIGYLADLNNRGAELVPPEGMSPRDLQVFEKIIKNPGNDKAVQAYRLLKKKYSKSMK